MTITLQTSEVYLGLAIIGIFSGIGSSLGQYIFQEIIKPRIHKHINKLNNIKIPQTLTINKKGIKIKWQTNKPNAQKLLVSGRVLKDSNLKKNGKNTYNKKKNEK